MNNAMRHYDLPLYFDECTYIDKYSIKFLHFNDSCILLLPYCKSAREKLLGVNLHHSRVQACVGLYINLTEKAS